MAGRSAHLGLEFGPKSGIAPVEICKRNRRTTGGKSDYPAAGPQQDGKGALGTDDRAAGRANPRDALLDDRGGRVRAGANGWVEPGRHRRHPKTRQPKARSGGRNATGATWNSASNVPSVRGPVKSGRTTTDAPLGRRNGRKSACIAP